MRCVRPVRQSEPESSHAQAAAAAMAVASESRQSHPGRARAAAAPPPRRGPHRDSEAGPGGGPKSSQKGKTHRAKDFTTECS
jgi:hypothetical protein